MAVVACSGLTLLHYVGLCSRHSTEAQLEASGGDTFVTPERHSLLRSSERALLVPRNGETEAKERGTKGAKGQRKGRRGTAAGKFGQLSGSRGTTGRGKKNHFHLLDRYIRRIDAAVPEDMEHLVRPLSYKPNMELSTHTLKITFDELGTITEDLFTEDDVLTFFEPDAPLQVAIFCPNGTGTQAEVYAHFAHNDLAQSARRHSGELLAGLNATVRYTVDDKWDRVLWKLDGGGVEDEETVEAFESAALGTDEDKPVEMVAEGKDAQQSEGERIFGKKDGRSPYLRRQAVNYRLAGLMHD